MNMIISQCEKNKGVICDEILHSVPEWFGIEEAIQDYVKKIENQTMYVAEADGNIVGFVGLEIHYEKSAEIYVMGIKKEFHRQGIGKKLIEISEEYLKSKGVEFLQVKTLSPSDPDKGYALTRKFYRAVGFVPFEEFKTLWGDANPCLMMIKQIG